MESSATERTYPSGGTKVIDHTVAHFVSERHINELGDFKLWVIDKDIDSSKPISERLLPSCTGSPYAFDNYSKPPKPFDKIKQLLSHLLPHLDHRSRVNVMVLSRTFLEICQDVTCYVNVDTKDVSTYQLELQKLVYNPNWKEEARRNSNATDDDIKQYVINDMVKVVRWDRRDVQAGMEHISVVHVHDNGRVGKTAATGKKKEERLTRCNDFSIQMLLLLPDIQDRIKAQKQATYQAKHDNLRKSLLVVQLHRLEQELVSAEAQKDGNEKIASVLNAIERTKGMLAKSPTFQKTHAGIGAVNFVNIKWLIPKLLQLSGLRELTDLQSLSIFNCANFNVRFSAEYLLEIGNALQKFHPIPVNVAWSFCSPIENRQFKWHMAMLTLLYRGAKKDFGATVSTGIESVSLMYRDLMERGVINPQDDPDEAYATIDAEIAQRYDLPCAYFFSQFFKAMMTRKDRNGGEVPIFPECTVLYYRAGKIAGSWSETAWKEWQEHLNLGKIDFDLEKEARLCPNESAMVQMEDLACKWILGTNITAQPGNSRVHAYETCNDCGHVLSGLFFPNTVWHGRNKQHASPLRCYGCAYFELETSCEEVARPRALLMTKLLNTNVVVDSIRSLQVLRTNENVNSVYTVSNAPTVEFLSSSLHEDAEIIGEISRMCPNLLKGRRCDLVGCRMGIPNVCHHALNLYGCILTLI